MITKSTVTRNGETKEVKNLGWLIRNWQEVESFCFEYNPDSKNMQDGLLIANLKNGGEYRTGYASLSVCFSWLNRSIFRGQPFTLSNKMDGTLWSSPIGDEEWKRIQKLEYKAFCKFFNLK